ncbi:response regulator [Ramlibacter sp. G-1-2-2]|uniref:Virulence sensor protein BvgS n=2 Tax=Ramlibacter agri TaxID=2728837 RepID=A0A848H7F5_9BURK|nr:response regulator [Ramlibacter agri]
MRFPPSQVRTRLAAGLLVIHLFVYGLAALSLVQSRHRHEAETDVARRNLAQALAASVAGSLDAIDVGLKSIALELQPVQAGGGLGDDATNAYLERQKGALHDVAGVWITDEAGTVRWGPGLDPARPLQVADRAYFARLRQDPAAGLVTSEPLVSRMDGVWTVLLARRINRPDGSFAGAVLGALDAATYFPARFAPLELGQLGQVTIRGEDLTLYARYDGKSADLSGIGERGTSAAARAALASNAVGGAYRARAAADGKERALAYQKVSRYPLYVFVSQRTGDMLGAWRGEVATTLGLLAIFTAASCFYTWSAYRRARQAQQAEDAALAATRAKSEFLANMSHEVRTPLHAVLALTHIVRRSGVTAEQARRLQQIEDQGEHLLGLLGDMLDLARIEAGRLQLESRDFTLAELLAEVAGLLRPQAQDRRIAFELDPQGPPVRLRGDLGRLRQALINYAGNAVKFTPEGGRVVLRAFIDGEAPDDGLLLRFEVIDTGIGIAAEKLGTIFDPFEQLDAEAARASGGTGLGLAITRGLAQAMGGAVGVSSTPGAGSTFWFTAAVQLAPEEADPVPGAAPDADALLLEAYRGRSVLLVEDNDISAEVVAELLAGAGLQVERAADGVEAVAHASRQAFDLVLMDMQLPRMDGLQATRAIRALPGWQARPIIALTASVFEETRRQCMEAGMSDFLGKPVRPAQLQETVEKWLRAAGSQLAAVGALAGMDARRVQEFSHREERYVGLLRALLASKPELAQLAAALERGDPTAATQEVHSFKGAAAMLGAERVTAAAAALEDALRRRQAADLPTLLAAVEDALAEIEAVLEPEAA